MFFMKKFFIISALYFSLVGFAAAQVGDVTNAGFVSGIWYSKTPFFVGETVRIYSAIQNQSGFDITGTIKFFDNGKIIGQSDFSAINGRLVEKWIDWEVSEGEHKIQAKIFNPKKSIPDGGEETISLVFGSPEVDKKFADIDTDGDGIGNKQDSDDDGDGISDSDEKKAGTNPLVFNKAEEKIVENKINETKSDSKLEEGKELAEQYVIEPTKKVTQKALAESKPIIEKIGELLQQDRKSVV